MGNFFYFRQFKLYICSKFRESYTPPADRIKVKERISFNIFTQFLQKYGQMEYETNFRYVGQSFPSSCPKKPWWYMYSSNTVYFFVVNSDWEILMQGILRAVVEVVTTVVNPAAGLALTATLERQVNLHQCASSVAWDFLVHGFFMNNFVWEPDFKKQRI
jgi:hypothetical protein